MSAETLIRKTIRSNGPITVAEYMKIALSDPEHGYYMRKDPLGVQGDFTTSPEIAQVFGEVIGAWCAAQWIIMGKPQTVLCELGPGRGTLMGDALRATKNIPGFHEAISVHLVETSPTLQEKQWNTLAGKHLSLHWHKDFSAVPQGALLLIANEFFDALPIRQFIHDDVRWSERMVGLNHVGKLRFVPQPIPNTENNGVFPASDDNFYEYSEASLKIVNSIARRMAKYGGAGLFIDYGYTGGRRADTLQAVKAHQYHEVLAEPGNADLTAHVDFTALARAAAQGGAKPWDVVPQGLFLSAIGAGTRTAALCEKASSEQKSAMISALERLVSPDKMGDLFKVLCITHPKHPKPEGL